MIYSILMVDIIGSRDKIPTDLMRDFKQLVKSINKTFKNEILSPFTITLGDEFQGVLKCNEDAIKIIFAIEEFIIEHKYNFKLNYVLNYGKIETEINIKNAYEMLGEGLTQARKLLNENKSSGNRFLIKLEPPHIKQEEYLNKAFLIFQNYIDNWKPKDLLAVYNFLRFNDYKAVSTKLNIDKSSAWRRKKSLNILEYNTIKELILYLNNT